MMRTVAIIGLLTWAVPANAGVNQNDLRRMVVELAPEVEEKAGRKLVSRPDSGILTRDEARELMAQPAPRLVPRTSEHKPNMPRIDKVLEHAVAIYIPSSEGIYLIKESFEELFYDLRLESDALTPVVRCAVRHELVHALQHQYGLQPLANTSEGATRGHSALIEGHATLIGQELCLEKEGKAISAAMDAAMMADVPSSVTAADSQAEYAWGQLLAEQLRGLGNEALWAALVAPSPEWTAIVETVEPLLTPGWDEPERLQALARFLTDGNLGEGSPISPTFALTPMLTGQSGVLLALPETEAGLTWSSRGALGKSLVVAMLFRDPGASVDLMQQRRQTNAGWSDYGVQVLLETGGAIVFLSSKTLRKLERREDVEGTYWMRLRSTSGRQYNEYWVATPHMLLIAITNSPHPAARDVQAGLAATVDGFTTPTARIKQERPDWLGIDLAPDPGPSWQYRLQLASRYKASGNERPCEAAFGDVLRMEAPFSDDMAVAAFLCAGATTNIDGVNALVDRVADYKPEVALVGVVALNEDDQALKALALIDAANVTEGPMLQTAADLRMLALAKLRRWKDLAAVALTERPSHGARHDAAVNLFNAGRRATARTILKEVCPLFEGEEAALCRSTQEQMR